MGDFWSGETEYDQNQDHRDARDAENERRRVREGQKMMNQYNTNPQAGFYQYGDGNTIQQQAANLSQVGVQTGQNMFQTGQQSQDYVKSLQARRGQDSAAAKHMLSMKNRNMANVGRQFAGKRVAGGVAAAGMNSAAEQGDLAAGKELQSFDRQGDQDLWNFVKRQQRVEGEALSSGKDSGLADAMDTAQGSGMFGTVICTELHRQGLMSDEIYEKDAEYGKFLAEECPTVIRGYHLFGVPLARKMKTSPRLTKLIKPFGLAWAKHIAGEDNILGMFIFMIGVPVCFTLGLFVPTRKVAHV